MSNLRGRISTRNEGFVNYIFLYPTQPIKITLVYYLQMGETDTNAHLTDWRPFYGWCCRHLAPPGETLLAVNMTVATALTVLKVRLTNNQILTFRCLTNLRLQAMNYQLSMSKFTGTCTTYFHKKYAYDRVKSSLDSAWNLWSVPISKHFTSLEPGLGYI